MGKMCKLRLRLRIFIYLFKQEIGSLSLYFLAFPSRAALL